MAKESIVTVGLGCGDESKGSTVDFLVDYYGAELVVRYTGASNPAHNVVEPNGRHQTFSQIGSGTLLGARTHISQYACINLLNLEAEIEELESKGVVNPGGLISIDTRSIFINPFQVHVNQMRELVRGRKRNGSCGKGVGETICDARNGYGIVWMDLRNPQELRKSLDFLWRYKIDHAEQLLSLRPSKQMSAIMSRLVRRDYVDLLADAYERILAKYSITFKPTGLALKEAKGVVIFEGAQGVLLDEEYGFFPHITHSRTTCGNANEIISDFKLRAHRMGILRLGATRHGQGPFVTEDKELSRKVPDEHNIWNQWQGHFRIGWFDLVTARYALEVSRGVDSLAITNIDRFSGFPELKIALSYEYLGKKERGLEKYFEYDRDGQGKIRITRIKPVGNGKSNELANFLKKCRPLEWKIFKGWELKEKIKKISNIPKEIRDILNFLEAEMGVPIKLLSFGPTREDKIWLSPLDKKRKMS